MKKLLIASVAVLTGSVATACFAPPGPTTTTTTTTAAPPELPVSPKMLLDPVGADGLAVLSEVQGAPEIAGWYLSTATWQRQLDLEVPEDRALVMAAFGRVDPNSGREVREVVDESTDARHLEMCTSTAPDAPCVPIPGTGGFSLPGFSPDGNVMVMSGWDPDAGLSTIRLVDAWTYEVITEVSASPLSTGVRSVWSPDSTTVAFVLDGGVATVAATTGAQPEVVTSGNHAGPESPQRSLTVVGWSDQDRIVSLWAELDPFGSPSLDSLMLQSVAPDGGDRRELGAVEPFGFSTVAPDGSVVVAEPVDVTQGTSGARGTAPVALTDAEPTMRTMLSRPWLGTTENGLSASSMSVVGFVEAQP